MSIIIDLYDIDGVDRHTRKAIHEMWMYYFTRYDYDDLYQTDFEIIKETENIERIYFIDDDYGWTSIEFKTEEDFLIFKLKWMHI